MAFFRFDPAPIREPITADRKNPVSFSTIWSSWLSSLTEKLNDLSPGVGQDIANSDVTLTWGSSAHTQICNTPLTADRTMTLSTTRAVNGSWFHVVRASASTGAFNLSVGGLVNLAPGQWCLVGFDGTSWFLTAFGSL